VQWYHNGSPIGNELFTFPYTIQVTEEGTYSAQVILDSDAITCDFLVNEDIIIDFEELYPETPQQNTWILEYCDNAHDTLA
jgi:hypothetical protein